MRGDSTLRGIPLDPRTGGPLNPEDLLEFIDNTFDETDEIGEHPWHLDREVESDLHGSGDDFADSANPEVAARGDGAHTRQDIAIFEFCPGLGWQLVMLKLFTGERLSIELVGGSPAGTADHGRNQNVMLVDFVGAVKDREPVRLSFWPVIERLYQPQLLGDVVTDPLEFVAPGARPAVGEADNGEVIAGVGRIATDEDKLIDQQVESGFEVVDEIAKDRSESDGSWFKLPEDYSEPIRIRLPASFKGVRLSMQPLVDGGFECRFVFDSPVDLGSGSDQ